MRSTTDHNRWEDIIFEDRHKEYGAYMLRRTYSTSVLVGALSTFVIVSLIFALPYLSRLFSSPVEAGIQELKAVKYTDLAPPPPIQNTPPPPRVYIPPPVK